MAGKVNGRSQLSVFEDGHTQLTVLQLANSTQRISIRKGVDMWRRVCLESRYQARDSSRVSMSFSNCRACDITVLFDTFR